MLYSPPPDARSDEPSAPPRSASAQRKRARHPPATRLLRPRIANLGLAGYLLACLGLSTWFLGSGATRIEWVDSVAYAAVTVVLAAQTLRRQDAKASDNRPWVIVLCTVSSLYFMGYQLGPPTWWLIALHWLGDLCLLSLGGSFALLPARRTIVRSGPYRFVRHPTYSSYLIADSLAVAAAPSLWNFGVWGIGVVTLVWRAALEEQLLAGDPAYQCYREQTRFRLVPGLY